jgi:hypothetical protein
MKRVTTITEEYRPSDGGCLSLALRVLVVLLAVFGAAVVGLILLAALSPSPW